MEITPPYLFYITKNHVYLSLIYRKSRLPVFNLQKITFTWDATLRSALATISAMIVNCFGTPYFILAAVPLSILYMCLQRFFTTTARYVLSMIYFLKFNCFTDKYFSLVVSKLKFHGVVDCDVVILLLL